jgi:serine/threonine protein kinase/Flp pilus assembly protein TadD
VEPCLTPADFDSWERGVADEPSRERFRAHLDSCSDCSREWERHCRQQDTGARPRQHALDLTSSMPPPPAEAGPTPDAAPDLHVPSIEGYRILGVLGQGGMGIVYRAHQAKLNRIVALKVLPAMIGRANPQAVTRFRREATSAARLHHTNIIPIYDFGESPHAYFYAMELITGLPLNDVIARLSTRDVINASLPQFSEVLKTLWTAGEAAVLDAAGSGVAVGARSGEGSGLSGPSAFTGAASTAGRGRVYFRQVARWMADAADALHYAHEQGVTHRDIKPGNLILSVDGRIMIADFGLALVAGEESVTMTGSLLGTLRYMSPEQAMAKRMRIDHRTDIWSLGAVMYELLTFQPAFPGADQKEVFGNILTREPTAPHKIITAIPRELETICLKTLEKDPAARYATARGLADDLRRYINDLPIAAKPPGALERALKFVRRHKAGVAGVTALVAVALLVLTAVLLTASFRRNREQRIAALVKQGRDDTAARNWTAAEQAFQQALQLNPKHVPTLFNLAIMKKDQFNSLGPKASRRLLEEADELCRRALARDPKNVGGLNTHGVVLKKLERYADARAAYARAVEIDPQRYNAWDNFAIVCAHEGDLKQAEALELKATQLAGTQDRFAAYCWRNLASLLLHRGAPGALDAIEKAIAADDLDPDSWLICARTKLAPDVHDFRAALDDIKHADRLAKGADPKVKRTLALAHLRSGEFADAIKQADLAVGLGDMSCINALIKSIAYARTSDVDAARRELRVAQDRWPPFLADEHAIAVSSERGLLWFDSADELLGLRAEANAALEPRS